MFRPRLVTAGIDAHLPSLDVCRDLNVHDAYIHADILKDDMSAILAPFNGQKFDIVTLIGVIEHLPKPEGHKLLEKCEQSRGDQGRPGAPGAELPGGHVQPRMTFQISSADTCQPPARRRCRATSCSSRALWWR
jgi:hypothetical protein